VAFPLCFPLAHVLAMYIRRWDWWTSERVANIVVVDGYASGDAAHPLEQASVASTAVLGGFGINRISTGLAGAFTRAEQA